MSALRVGIDLCRIDPAALVPADHAILDTLDALAASPPDGIQPVLFGSRALAAARPVLFAAFESHTLPFPPAVRPARVAAQATWLRRAVGRARLDLLHDAGTSPARSDVPAIVSVHDLTPFERPRGLNRLRVAYHRQVVPRALGGARLVLAPSTFVRRRLAEALDVSEAKVAVVPWPLPPHAESAPIDTVRARHGIIGQIVLMPAATTPEQDHLVAVRAMRHLAGRHKETTLVLIGDEGPAERQVTEEIRSLGVQDRVVRLGPVSEAVRASLFEHAAVVVHPAVYGGFADVVLEAMACGVPVVVADVGAAPELAHGAGAVIPHGDDAQLAVEVHRVLDDPEWRRRMVDAGLERARGYTAPEVADQLVAAYRSVLVAR